MAGAERAGLRSEQVSVVLIDGTTRGQAETVLAARSQLRDSDELLVFNTDTHVDPQVLKRTSIRGAGWISVFRAEGDRWSFVDAEPDGRAKRVTEKQQISDLCSVRLYYFDSFARFRVLLDRRVEDGREWYIAPPYQQLIADGHAVYVEEIPSDAVYVLGTPEDLLAAEARLRSSQYANDVWAHDS